MPPTPASVRARVLDLREAALSESANLAEQSGGALPDVPEVSERIPDDVQAVLNRREGAEPMPGLNRWRLTFMSAGPASSDEE